VTSFKVRKKFTHSKTKVFAAVYGKNFVILDCTVLIQSQNVTDIQTHERLDDS